MKSITAICIAILAVFLGLAKGGNSDLARAVLTGGVSILFCWIFLFTNKKNQLTRISPRTLSAWAVVWITVSLCLLIQLYLDKGKLLTVPEFELCNVEAVCKNSITSSHIISTLNFWAVFSAYWVVVLLVSNLDSSAIKLIAASILLLAIFQIIYGVFSFLGDQQTIIGIWKKEHYIGDATGTYVNRNHYSGFLEVSWPLGLSTIYLLLRSKKRRISVNWTRLVFLGLFSLLMAIALFSSHSRLGAISAIIGVLVWLLLINKKSIQRTSQRRSAGFRWIKTGVIGFVVFGVIWFGIDGLLTRFSLLSLEEPRYVVWSSTLNFSPDIWIFGLGAGNFLDTFRTIQPIELESVFDYAHNDYLEYLLDFGLIGTVLTLIAGFYWYRKVKPINLSIIQIGALAGISSILVHSIADFNLHIPGVAIIFWISVGILINPNLSGIHRKTAFSREGSS